jgi:hypothetical protein
VNEPNGGLPIYCVQKPETEAEMMLIAMLVGVTVALAALTVAADPE